MIGKMLESMRNRSRAHRNLRDLRELRARGLMDQRILKDIGLTEANIDDTIRRVKYWI